MSQGDGALLDAARRIVDQLVGVRAGERVTLVTDPAQPEAVQDALARALDERGAERVTALLLREDLAAPAIPAGIARVLGASDVIVSTAGRLLTHTDAVRAALARGARYCNLRDLSADTLLVGAGCAPPDAVRRITAEAARALTSGRRMEVTDANGSRITLETNGIPALALDGAARLPGSIGGVPAGEASVVPAAASVEGTIVGPYLIEGIGSGAGIEVAIRAGRVASVRGEGGEALERRLASHDLAAVVGEIALGTNPASRLLVGREAKKRLGTMHIGLGDNVTFGGTIHCPVHLDLVLDAPTVRIDGRELISAGRSIWTS